MACGLGFRCHDSNNFHGCFGAETQDVCLPWAEQRRWLFCSESAAPPVTLRLNLEAREFRVDSPPLRSLLRSP
jgi:hypothetical protein